MTNPIKGEVSVKTGEKEYTLLFNTNVLCELENEMGMSVSAISEKWASGSPSFSDTRKIFWVGLRAMHGGISLDDTGKIIDSIGIKEAFKKLMEALVAAFPSGESDGGTVNEEEKKIEN